MFTVKTKEQFISDIRALDDNLKNIRLSSISVNRTEKSICYDFICDKVVDQRLKDLILEQAEIVSQSAFKTVVVTVKKIASDSELVCNAIYNFLTANYPSISIFLKTTDVVCKSVLDGEVRYTLKLTKDSIDYVSKNGILRKLNEHLAKNFCSEFLGSFEEKEPEETISLLEEEVFISELQEELLKC